ncbi:MAG: hypothetical protein WKF57_06215 [Nakamurella sp.]
MKKIMGGLAAAAVLFTAACGSTTATPTTQTVTSMGTVTASVTKQVTEQVTNTETVSETLTETATKTVAKPVPTTVVKTEVKTVPQTVQVTVTAEPAGTSVPNGDYLVGKDIEPGTYQCKDATDRLYWEADDASGEILDNDLGSIARFTSEAYTIKLSGCAGDWKRAG